MHHPRQRADICSTGSLWTTVGRSLTCHTAEVWSLIGGAAPCRMLLSCQDVYLSSISWPNPPSSPEFHGRPPVFMLQHTRFNPRLATGRSNQLITKLQDLPLDQPFILRRNLIGYRTKQKASDGQWNKAIIFLSSRHRFEVLWDNSRLFFQFFPDCF